MDKKDIGVVLATQNSNDNIVEDLQSQFSVKVIADLDELSLLSKVQNQKVVFLYTKLADFLVQSLHRKEKLSDAVNSWKKMSDVLINYFKFNRGAFSVISSQSIRFNPAEFFSLLNVEAVPLTEWKPTTEDILIVNHVISLSSELQKNDKYLDAISTPLGPIDSENKLKISDLDSLVESRANTLHKLNSKIETQKDTMTEQAASIKSLEENLSSLENEVCELDLQLVNAHEIINDSDMLQRGFENLTVVAENELISVKENLAESEFEKRRLRRQRDRLEKQLENDSEQLLFLKGSLQKNKEELERVKTEKERLSESVNIEKKKSVTSVKVLAREKQKLESALTEQQRQNSKMLAELTLMKKELEQVKGSTLWAANQFVQKAKNKISNRGSDEVSAQDISLLATSEYFDIKWYLDTYKDVAASDIHPAEHYLIYGFEEGRLPSPSFDGNWYLSRYPDVAESGVNPLLHYIKYGKAEGRVASPKMLSSKSKEN